MQYSKIFIICLLMCSCVKAPQPPKNTHSGPLKGKIMVVNEGLFQQNNATLSLIDPETGAVQNNWFSTTIGRPLGDTGNDIIQVGNKIFVIVNVSGTIEVIKASDGTAIKQIEMQSDDISKEPRNALEVNGDVWVSSFDGTVSVIDTATLQIENDIEVGNNPEGLTQWGNYVYVTNSGALNYPNYDSTVSVIDVTNQTVQQQISVGINPGAIDADQYGTVYVLSRGNYNDIPGRLYMINAQTHEVTEWERDSVQSVRVRNDYFFVIRTVNGKPVYEKYDVLNQQKVNEISLPWDQIETFYGLQHLNNGKYIMLDAAQYTSNGWVYWLQNDASVISSWQVGLNPSAVLKIK